MSHQGNQQDGIVARIYYQGFLYQITRKREESLTLSKTNHLGGLIESLIERYGVDFARALLTPAGELRRDVGILIDGVNPAHRGALAYSLAGETSFTVEIASLGSPPVGGVTPGFSEEASIMRLNQTAATTPEDVWIPPRLVTCVTTPAPFKCTR